MICKFFLKNKCNRDDCKYSHDIKVLKRESQDENVIPIKKQTEQTKQTKLMPRVKGKNTVNWIPSEFEDMRVILDLSSEKLTKKWTNKDVLVCPNVFSSYKKYELYNSLKDEVHEDVLKLWHGNETNPGTHVIADDSMKWKTTATTFKTIVDTLAKYFNMKVSATRFNWYRTLDEWKPYHHDRAAVEAKIALRQNVTVAVSFGCVRGCAFEHAKTKTVVNFPQEDTYVYVFFDETNVIWRHGVFRGRESEIDPNGPIGRMSIILWGWIDPIN